MKASELIKYLASQISRTGDAEVKIYNPQKSELGEHWADIAYVTYHDGNIDIETD